MSRLDRNFIAKSEAEQPPPKPPNDLLRKSVRFLWSISWRSGLCQPHILARSCSEPIIHEIEGLDDSSKQGSHASG